MRNDVASAGYVRHSKSQYLPSTSSSTELVCPDRGSLTENYFKPK
jgi:hypothetical protein